MVDPRPQTAAALIIGNELLSGKICDENLVVLARMLRTVGIALRRVVVIPDDADLIASEVRQLARAFDIVFTSGGVGPTHDDLTVAAVARAFDVELHVAPELRRLIEAHMGERLTPGHLLMARVPQGAELVSGDDMRWPTIHMRNVWVLPGVPEIFRRRLGPIARRLAGGRPFVSRAVYTNLDEGRLVPLLDTIVARYPRVDVGSYPQWNEPSCRTKLTFDGLEREQVDLAVEEFLALLPEGEPQRVE